MPVRSHPDRSGLASAALHASIERVQPTAPRTPSSRTPARKVGHWMLITVTTLLADAGQDRRQNDVCRYGGPHWRQSGRLTGLNVSAYRIGESRLAGSGVHFV